ncbi:iron-siderophore ABC transporter substrate-binding protein [Streptomyces triticirhizae]|uniref:Iron-siderophore ABC transporter substrate-binding protein n=1 Tax=Streptomyces triticirhizae TaxID=2483353 RepID=A0A3M2LRS3_9ACTN|nr:iron-siderophore ABC transporter substrate-binding protein [Streptomyces triticirhizae]RMI40097.1 iron-siderophore ABC transporter substrate-binding protein [Streptomyces triticirhizae]
MPSPLRHGRLLLAALLLGATLAGCGSDDSDGSESGGSDDAAPVAGAEPEPGAFPVTIEHRYGSTTLEERPERVVTVGLSDQDAVLALGTVPVGTTEWLALHESAIGPWAEEYLGDAERPTLLQDPGTGPQVEEIALLDPDLILALYSGITREQYDALSAIAPVVAAPEDVLDYGISWQEQTLVTGQALGRPAEAERLVGEVEGRIAEEAAAHPEFAEATGVVATPYEGMFLYGGRDPRSNLLTGLGFSLPEGLDEVMGGEFGANISRERTDLLDHDVAVWIVTDPETDAEALHEDPLYGELPVVTEGREVLIANESDYGAAFNFGTVLSLPYVVDRLVPQLEQAVDGDPATVVEQPADAR